MLAFCIGCGCHDQAACENEAGDACHWLAVDYEDRKGVCSACPDDLVRWVAGDREPATMLPGDDDEFDAPG